MQKSRKRFVSIVCIVLVVILLASLVLTAFSSAFAVTQSEIDALKNQQAAISQQKDELKNKLNGLQNEMTTAVEKKTALDEQNELARQEIELINEQIDLYDKLIAKKAEELEAAKASEEQQKEALRVRMRAMEENSNITYLSILFNANGFSDLLARISDLNSIMSHDKQLEDAYIAARENVETVKAEYEATQKEQEETRAVLEAKKAELETQIESAMLIIAELDKNIDALRKEYEANDAQEQSIRSQIDTKIAELEKQQQQQIAQGNGGNIITGSGNFSWPTPGHTSISSPFGNRTHPIFGDQRFHSGIDISAPSGASIVAADSGTVVTAVYSSSYGNYVVISHGGGNSTLYAHMSSMAVSAGQTVNKGDTIGYVGSTGWSTGAHLHFEIKIAGALVDPQGQF